LFKPIKNFFDHQKMNSISILKDLIPKWKTIKNNETTARDLLSLERTLFRIIFFLLNFI